MDIFKESLNKHREWRGKIEMRVRAPLADSTQLSLAYTPGVAEPCRAIQRDPGLSYELTRRWNTVAVVTDGTAVLGLGDIGPEAGMPVMEGKCALFKEFADIDAIPLCIRSKNVEEIVRTIALLSGSFGGINMEDISAPRCFEIEKKLQEVCDIPVFHDDQHGTAIVVGAALINALKLARKELEAVRIVINGAGSAGIAICRFLLFLGAADIIMVDRQGIISEGVYNENPAHTEIAKLINKKRLTGSLSEAVAGADVFIGVSAADCLSPDMVRSMAAGAIVFALANPVPEIRRSDALGAGALVYGSGASGQPNQINNLLAFPGIFRGALDIRARKINTEMKAAAALALAGLVLAEELNPGYIIPSPFDPRVVPAVSRAVAEAAVLTGISGRNTSPS